MENKMIAKKLHKIHKGERILDKLVKYLESDIGRTFVRMIGFMPIDALTVRYNCPSLAKIKSRDAKMNLLMHAVARSGRGNDLRFNKLIDYTHLGEKEAKYDKERERFVKNYQERKPSVRLLPYEQKVMNKRDEWEVRKDSKGKPIIKSEKDVNNPSGILMLYDKVSGLPIYEYKRKKHGLGLAYKLHAYELHKMAKYDKRAAIQEEIDKRGDLFPGQIVQKYKMLREAYLEQLRIDLSDKYCPRKVTVVVQDKNSGNVTKIPTFEVLKIGEIRGRKLKDANSRMRLMTITNNITQNNPNIRVTCVHANNTFNRGGKVLLPYAFQNAA